MAAIISTVCTPHNVGGDKLLRLVSPRWAGVYDITAFVNGLAAAGLYTSAPGSAAPSRDLSILLVPYGDVNVTVRRCATVAFIAYGVVTHFAVSRLHAFGRHLFAGDIGVALR
jgi:hypothetical protein